MGAMPEEISTITGLLTGCTPQEAGGRTYYSGLLQGIKTVVVFSRWGKVAAAITVTTLIHQYGITELIFTGVAGAISQALNIGDIVIAQRLIQHDMDARPLMPQYEIPLLNVTCFACGGDRVEQAEVVIRALLNKKHLAAVIEPADMDAFNIHEPRLFIGDIASGDKFFSGTEEKHKLMRSLPSVLCVEMEGAAVAQVCYEYHVPFTIIRTISDTADENAHIDFPLFIKKISSKYSEEIIKLYYAQWA